MSNSTHTQTLLRSVNTGLKVVLKDIADTHNLNFDELCERYVYVPTQKTKRKGHVSNYNMFVKTYGAELREKNPEISFAEASKQAGEEWRKGASNDKNLQKRLDKLREQYVVDQQQAVQSKSQSKDVAPAPKAKRAPVAAPSDSSNAKKSRKPAVAKAGKA